MPRKQKNIIRKTLLVVLGLSLIAAGGYFLYIAFSVKKVVIQAPVSVVKASSQKKTAAEKQAYSVPPNHPRELTIKKLGVDANVLAVGAPKGIMGAPASAWDVGWYDRSGLPGASGALLVDGHVNDALGSPGIFYNLAKLANGDELTVQRGDGQMFTYSVVKVEDVPLDKVDMSALLASAEKGKQGLNLITCGGTYDYKKQTYDHRILVFAVQT